MKRIIVLAVFMAALVLAVVVLTLGVIRPQPASAETPAAETSGIPDTYFRNYTPTVLEWEVNNLAPAMMQYGEASGCGYYGYSFNKSTGEVVFIFMFLNGKFARDLLATCVTNAFHSRMEDYPLRNVGIKVINLSEDKMFGCLLADKKWKAIEK